MHNDPELSPKFLGKISSDFIKVSDHLKEASYQIRKRDFSKFPVFVISQEAIPLGSLLYEKNKMGNEWAYHASFAEEFVERKLIENMKDFMAVYKDPDEFCCLFVLHPDFTNFTFIPYPDDDDQNVE